MLKIDVISLFPEMIEDAIAYGVLGQAVKEDLLGISAHSPRVFAKDKHKTVDDRPFGGGDGMIMLPEPLEKSILQHRRENSKVIYLSPQGARLTDGVARELSTQKHIIFICGRYGGVDQRVLNKFVDQELSIGDYVLSGGELGALVCIDAIARFIPGVLGHSDSAEKDSFSEGLLEHPNYTRPRTFLDQEVPEVLLGGNHQTIADWKRKVSALVTLKKRPDLFKEFIKKENANYLKIRRKKSVSPIEDLKIFLNGLTEQEQKVLGLDGLQEEDLNV